MLNTILEALIHDINVLLVDSTLSSIHMSSSYASVLIAIRLVIIIQTLILHYVETQITIQWSIKLLMCCIRWIESKFYLEMSHTLSLYNLIYQDPSPANNLSELLSRSLLKFWRHFYFVSIFCHCPTLDSQVCDINSIRLFFIWFPSVTPKLNSVYFCSAACLYKV